MSLLTLEAGNPNRGGFYVIDLQRGEGPFKAPFLKV
jgi:hypothetical protein